jgi:hypothetical protein
MRMGAAPSLRRSMSAPRVTPPPAGPQRSSSAPAMDAALEMDANATTLMSLFMPFPPKCAV